MFRFFLAFLMFPLLVLAEESQAFKAALDARLEYERFCHDTLYREYGYADSLTRENLFSRSFALSKKSDSLKALLPRKEQYRLNKAANVLTDELRLSARVAKKVMSFISSASYILNNKAVKLAYDFSDKDSFSSLKAAIAEKADSLNNKGISWLSAYIAAEKDPARQMLRVTLLIVCLAAALLCLKSIIRISIWVTGWIMVLSSLLCLGLLVWCEIDSPAWLGQYLSHVYYTPLILTLLLVVVSGAIYFTFKVTARKNGMSLVEYASVKAIHIARVLLKKYILVWNLASLGIIHFISSTKEFGLKEAVKKALKELKSSKNANSGACMVAFLSVVVVFSMTVYLFGAWVLIVIFPVYLFFTKDYWDMMEECENDGNAMRIVARARIDKIINKAEGSKKEIKAETPVPEKA